MTLFIGLTGLAGSGKDTACAEIKNILSDKGISVYSFALADPLKQAASILFGVDVNHFYADKQQMCEQWGITYRTMLQQLGTEFAREMIDSDFWTKRADLVYNDLLDINPDVVLCTDVRFNNEARWVTGRKGYMVEIQRGISLLDGAENQHASEAGIDPDHVSCFVDNNATIEDMNTQLRVVLQGFGLEF